MRQATEQEKARYRQQVTGSVPKPKLGSQLGKAFLVGGAICVVGQGVYDLFGALEPSQGERVAATLAAMIFLGALATALGVYDILAEWGGAGAALPITGFSNTMTAAAMEFRREGLILGVGARMFTIAGPVIVYGILAGLAVGLIRLALSGHLGSGSALG
ncbi:MAG TPA: SpoVA/SpoVAEb family sporulation membrane protein [Limnochordia bacterium]|nr:SpoVA/SpoVAEb family sporulation membrane protein [Limnochordia bacterium]